MQLLENRPDGDLGADEAMGEALLAERRAYHKMRRLVPDLDLPVSRRRPLTAEQQRAVDNYGELRELLETMRGAHRKALPKSLALVRG